MGDGATLYYQILRISSLAPNSLTQYTQYTRRGFQPIFLLWLTPEARDGVPFGSTRVPKLLRITPRKSAYGK
jgi:hypothetical protein